MPLLRLQAYQEWDINVRNLVHSRALLAAVLCGDGNHPGVWLTMDFSRCAPLYRGSSLM